MSLEVPVMVSCKSAGAVSAGDDDVLHPFIDVNVHQCSCVPTTRPTNPRSLSAVDVGTDMLELDCHLTKDEQVVVSHDANLQRCTGMDGHVSDLTYSVSPRNWNANRTGTGFSCVVASSQDMFFIKDAPETSSKGRKRTAEPGEGN